MNGRRRKTEGYSRVHLTEFSFEASISPKFLGNALKLIRKSDQCRNFDSAIFAESGQASGVELSAAVAIGDSGINRCPDPASERSISDPKFAYTKKLVETEYAQTIARLTRFFIKYSLAT